MRLAVLADNFVPLPRLDGRLRSPPIQLSDSCIQPGLKEDADGDRRYPLTLRSIPQETGQSVMLPQASSIEASEI